MFGKLRILLWIGVVLVLLPLVGVPHTWKNVLLVVLGVWVVYLVFRIKYAYKKVLFSLRETTPTELHHE